MQHADGAWPWFPGGPANDYITLYITTGFGRLRHLGVQDRSGAPAVKSLTRLDAWIDRDLPRDPEARPTRTRTTCRSTIALYLYGRSFFLQDKPIAAEHKEAVDYCLGQAQKYWLQAGQPPVAGAPGARRCKRFGDSETPQGDHGVASRNAR